MCVNVRHEKKRAYGMDGRHGQDGVSLQSFVGRSVGMPGVIQSVKQLGWRDNRTWSQSPSADENSHARTRTNRRRIIHVLVASGRAESTHHPCWTVRSVGPVRHPHSERLAPILRLSSIGIPRLQSGYVMITPDHCSDSTTFSQGKHSSCPLYRSP
jgi:hypothetical protein